MEHPLFYFSFKFRASSIRVRMRPKKIHGFVSKLKIWLEKQKKNLFALIIKAVLKITH